MRRDLEKAIVRGHVTLGHNWGSLAGCSLVYWATEKLFGIIDESKNVLFCRTHTEMKRAIKRGFELNELREAA